MCGRYTLRTPWQRLAEYFGLRVTDLPELFADRFNIAPSQPVLNAMPPFGTSPTCTEFG